MTAAQTAPVSVHREDGGPLVGTATLVRFMLRRDRVRLPGWVAGFGLFTVYLAGAIPAAYGSEEDLEGATSLFADPIGRLVTGPGYGMEDPTYERFIANGYGLYFLLLSALMSILLVVRHTRLEEQTGRAELVRADVVGPVAPLSAALVVAVITNLACAFAVFVVMVVVGGFAIGGSLLFAAGVAAVGLAFAGLASVTAQVTEYSRAAAGLAGAVLGASFALRSGGDMVRQGGSALSWLSPLGWGQQTAPFVLDRWWPLALPVLAAVATTVAGYALSTRRDLGAGLLAVRSGAPRARPSLGTPWGLALRLQRASLFWWTVAMALSGLLFGAFTDALVDALDDMPEAFRDLFGEEDLVAGYLAYMATYMAFVVSAFAVLAVQGLRNEETGGRLEPVLATGVSRTTWLGSNLAVSGAGVLVIMAVTGFSTGVGAAIVTSDGSHVVDLTVAHVNQVPGVLVVLGAGVLMFGCRPRAIGLAWVVVGYGAVVGTFGPLVDLPQLAFDLSPFGHAAEMPLERFAPVPVVLLGLLALAAVGLGLRGFVRRGINVA